MPIFVAGFARLLANVQEIDDNKHCGESKARHIPTKIPHPDPLFTYFIIPIEYADRGALTEYPNMGALQIVCRAGPPRCQSPHLRLPAPRLHLSACPRVQRVQRVPARRPYATSRVERRPHPHDRHRRRALPPAHAHTRRSPGAAHNPRRGTLNHTLPAPQHVQSMAMGAHAIPKLAASGVCPSTDASSALAPSCAIQRSRP